MLSVRNISVGYKKGELVLNDLNFSLKSGEILGILGPNGAGKTTLLRCINAILKPSSGNVFVEGSDIFRMNAAEIAKCIGYVPQRNEAGRISVFDAVLLGRIPHLRWQVTKEDLIKVDSILGQLELRHLALRNLNELSGGELQKVCIARSLVQEPKVLLLDEPTSSLDLKNQLEILEILRKVAAEHKMIVIAAMHDLNLAFRFMDRFLFIKDKRMFAAGVLNQIDAATVAAVYGVQVDIFRHNGQVYVVPNSCAKKSKDENHT